MKLHAYLTMTSGARKGSNYLLDESQETRIGRGLDCQIVLNDPRSSRVHAVIYRDEDGWWARDADSRNGTYLNSQKIDNVRLLDSAILRIGNSEFTFRLTPAHPSTVSVGNLALKETIVLDSPMCAEMTNSFAAAALGDEEHAKDLLDLYQLAITLLGHSSRGEVLATSLELLHDRCRASLAGFLWPDEEGRLLVKQVWPEDVIEPVRLSDTLTELVSHQRHAVWLSEIEARGGVSDSLEHFADAICVPLLHGRQLLGAIHLYKERERFRQSDFEIAVSVANILSVALVKTRQIARLRADHERLVAKSAACSELLGESPPIRELKGKIPRIGRTSGCVLIRGESGCGKELVAQALHKSSPRADRPMLSVNCAAIPQDLMESQLFGHRKGAFTGADGDHMGWFEQADSGTLFLDEIGELTLEGQAKLLRILESHPFLPIGGRKEVHVDVRVIAATNRDLAEFVREGRFREDLYYRLSVFELEVPPLRERGQDIELLLDHFLDHFRGQHGRGTLELSAAARQKLLAYNWPGNVRQLRNVIDSAVVLAAEDEVRPEDLGLRSISGDELESLRLDFWERKLIKEALSRTAGSVAEAAKLLGIGRATLYRKVDEYGMK